MLLSKTSYRQVVKNLDHYRQQHLDDRKENPNAIPPSWGIPLKMMIENVVRSNHERCPKDLADKVLEYLVTKGLLVHYAGDYTFPTDERLPSKEEIVEEAKKHFRNL